MTRANSTASSEQKKGNAATTVVAEHEAPLAPADISQQAAPAFNKLAFNLADEIGNKTFMMRPLFRLMHQEVENGFCYDPEKDPCAAQAMDALFTLIDTAQTRLTTIKKLCDDAQLAAQKGADALAVDVEKREVEFDGGMKAEQLAVLTRLIADKAAGFNLEMDEEDVMLLSALAADLSRGIVAAVAHDSNGSKKGG